MDGFKFNDVSDVYVGDKLAKQVYVGNTKVWDYKTPPVYTAPTAKAGLTYNGSAQALLNAGSTSHGTIQYSSDGSTWGTSIPTSTNASNAITVYWRLVGDGRHNDVPSTALTASIAKVTPTVTAPTAKNLTYTGSSQTLANAGSTNWGTLQYSSDNSTWSTTIPSATNAGNSYKVYYRVVGNSNINDVASASITCAIAKVAPTYTAPTAKTLTYNGNSQALLNAGSTSHGTIQYSTDNSTWSTTIPSGTNATSYTTYWRLVGDSNHTDVSSKSIACSISKVTPTVTAPTAKALTYSGAAQGLVNAGSTNFGTLQYSLDNSTWGTSIPTGTNATSYTVYYRVVGNSNINDVAAKSIACSIGKVTPTVTAPTAKVLTYNTSAQALVNAGSTNFGTLKYSLDNSTWSTSIPTATNYGSYTVYYKVDGDSNINDVPSASVSCSINEKKVTATVTLSQDTYTYDGTEHTPTVTVKDGSTVIPASEYTVLYSNNINAGTATVTISDNAGGNYEVIGSATFTVAQREVTLTWGTRTWTYDKTAHSTTCTAGNLVSGDTCSVTLTGNTITNKGTATVTASSLSNANYKLPSSKTATLTINARTVTLNWGTLTWTYDAAAHGTTCTAGNLCSGDTCTVTLTGNSITDNGTTTVTASSLSNSNYALPSTKTATLTITARPINVTAASASKTYDGTALTSNSATAEATSTNRGLVNGHSMTSCTVTGTITAKGSANNVPSAAVIKTSGGTDVTSNYTITYVNGTLTINAKALTITANAQSIQWGNSISTGTGQVTTSGLVSGDSLTGVTLAASTTDLTTTGTITPSAASTTKGAGNYSITYNTGTLTITQRAITITAKAQSVTYGTSITTGTGQVTIGGSGLASNNSLTSINFSASRTTVGSGTITPSSAVIKNGTTDVSSKYSITYNTGTLTITAKALTITAKNQSISFGDSISMGTSQVTASGLVSGDNLTAVTLTASTTAVTTSGTITPSAVSTSQGASNYSITYSNGTLTISKRAITITAKAQTVTYGTAISQGTSYVTTSSLGRLTLSAITLTQSTTNVTTTGTITPSAATIKDGTTDVTTSCTLTYSTGVLTINAKAISIPAPTGVSRAYNGSAASATFGACTGASITKYRYSTNNSTWTESTTNPTQTNAGTLYTQAYYTADSNHSGSGWSASATIAIAKANISPTVSMNGWVWGETAQSPSVSGNTGSGTVTYTYLYPGASSYVSTAPVSKSDIGQYTVKATIAATTNYNGATATKAFSILTNFKPSGSDAYITSDGKYYEVKTT